jgi:hypothetical protein
MESCPGTFSSNKQLSFTLDTEVRFRVLRTLHDILANGYRHFSIHNLLNDLEPVLLRKHGRLRVPPPEQECGDIHAVAGHFLACTEEELSFFMESAFRSWFLQDTGAAAVDEINRIFREDYIGYELTPWIETVGAPVSVLDTGVLRPSIQVQYPKMVKLDHLHQHEATIRPALHILADDRFRTANQEMLKAHDDFRQGRFADAITSCGAAFESTLKTICSLKGWAFDSDRDSCSTLIGICRNNGLFPGFYVPIFEATGTVRNKLGDAHGRGPLPLHSVENEHVQHLLQMTSAHIILLVSSAKL